MVNFFFFLSKMEIISSGFTSLGTPSEVPKGADKQHAGCESSRSG